MRRPKPLQGLLFLLAAALFAAVLPPNTAFGAAHTIDPFAYRVTLEGAVFTLPCSADTLAQAGWQTQVPADEPFGAGLYACIPYQKGEARVTATIANLGEEPAVLETCSLVGLTVQENEAGLELAGGVAPGAGREQVLAVYGAPDRRLHGSGLGKGVAAPGAPYAAADVDLEGETASPQDAAETDTGLLRYTTGRHSFLQFTFDADGVLQTVELQNLQAAPALPDLAALPAEAQAYSAPVSLGKDWQTCNVEYAGALYTLPAPVWTFLQNGWTLLDEAALRPDQWLLGVQLQKGNQILRTRVQNLSGEETGLAGCFVTAVESSSVGADVPIRLPGGVDRDSTKADIEAAWGPPHGLYQSATALTWLYYGGEGQITCLFWNDSEELYSLAVGYTGPS